MLIAFGTDSPGYLKLPAFALPYMQIRTAARMRNILVLSKPCALFQLLILGIFNRDLVLGLCHSLPCYTCKEGLFLTNLQLCGGADFYHHYCFTLLLDLTEQHLALGQMYLSAIIYTMESEDNYVKVSWD